MVNKDVHNMSETVEDEGTVTLPWCNFEWSWVILSRRAASLRQLWFLDKRTMQQKLSITSQQHYRGTSAPSDSLYTAAL